jgi:hypothetical protein
VEGLVRNLDLDLRDNLSGDNFHFWYLIFLNRLFSRTEVLSDVPSLELLSTKGKFINLIDSAYSIHWICFI